MRGVTMKIIETLTTKQITDLFRGEVVGIFPFIIHTTDDFYSLSHSMCLGYYFNRSGEKTISPAYRKIIEAVTENSNITTSADSMIGKLIRGKFIDKWYRIYNALITSQYNPLLNREYTEDKTGNNQNKDTHNTVKAKQGTNSDITTYDTNVEDNGKTGTSETTTRNVEDANDVYGFNSTTPVGDTHSNETINETVVGEAEKNTSHNIQTKTGTENKQFGINESETHSGTDTTDITIDEKIIRSGRDGSGAELITEELNLRNTQIFFDIVYADIDSITALQIYI